jgi:hypothetical protein
MLEELVCVGVGLRHCVDDLGEGEGLPTCRGGGGGREVDEMFVGA